MKKMWQHYETAQEFDDLMLAFHQTGVIVTDNIGNQIVYTMPESQVKEWTAFMSGKSKRQ